MTSSLYAWYGVDRQGKVVQGKMQAKNASDVTQQLTLQRIRTTRVHRHYKLPSWLGFKQNAKPSVREISQFTRQISTLLHAGIPLLQALSILIRSESKESTRHIFATLHERIENGIAFNQALRTLHVFDALYCNIVAVGELTGRLDIMLDRLAIHLEKSENLHRNIRTALIYPTAVIGTAMAVMGVIMIFVVPAFQNIFSTFGGELPWLTQCVINLSALIQRDGLLILVTAAAAVWWIRRQIRQRNVWRRYVHTLLLQLPIAGELTRNACTAQWTRTLATLCTAGIPLTEALDAIHGITNHVLFQEATRGIQQALIEGRTLAQALENTQNLFPVMLTQMCAIGEESGALEELLNKTAEHYEREVESTVSHLSTLLEPFIMVILGLIIGGLVMALYLPIFELGQVV